MIREAKVNRIIHYGSVLREHLEDARAGTPEPGLLALFKTLRQLTCVGTPFPTELEGWAVAQGIRMTVMELYTMCHKIVSADT